MWVIDEQYAMDMIRHNHKIVKAGKWKMIGYLFPASDRNLP